MIRQARRGVVVVVDVININRSGLKGTIIIIITINRSGLKVTISPQQNFLLNLREDMSLIIRHVVWNSVPMLSYI